MAKPSTRLDPGLMAENVASAVRAARAHRNLTQAQVAEAARTSEPTVGAIEAGRDTKVSVLLRVCAALGLRPRLALEED